MNNSNIKFINFLKKYAILNDVEKSLKVDNIDIYEISISSRKLYNIKEKIKLEDNKLYYKLSESNAFFIFLVEVLKNKDLKGNNNDYCYILVFLSGLDLLYNKINYNTNVTVISISYLLSIIDSRYEPRKNNNLSSDLVIQWLTNILYNVYNTILLKKDIEEDKFTDITNIKKVETEDSIFNTWCFIFNDFERKQLLKDNRGNMMYKHLYINTMPENYSSHSEVYCNKPIQYYNNYLYKNNISGYIITLELLNKIGVTYNIELINLNFEYNIDFIKKNLVKKTSILFSEEVELSILLSFITNKEDKEFINKLLEIMNYKSFREHLIPYISSFYKDGSILKNLKISKKTKEKIKKNNFKIDDIEDLLNIKKKKDFVRLNSSGVYYDQFNSTEEANLMDFLSGKCTHLDFERNKQEIFFFLTLIKDTDVFRYKEYFDGRIRQNLLSLYNYVGSKLLRYCLVLKHDKKKFLPVKKEDDNNIYYIFYIMNQIKTYYTLEEAFNDYNVEILNDLETFDKKKVNYANLLKIKYFQSHSTIAIDATSSVLQIIAILMNNTKLMKYTNVLGSNTRKYDIYDYLIEKYIIKDDKLSNHKHILLLKKRKYFKNVCMTYIYGSNAVNISKDLKKDFEMDYFLDIKELNKVTGIIIKILDKEFPFLSLVKKLYKLYNSCIPITKDIIFNVPSLFKKSEKFIYNNGKKIEKKFFIKKENKKPKYKDISFVFKRYPERIYVDVDKKNKAIFVNSIHRIDAFLALYVKSNLLKENIHCKSIHDSFVVNITNYKRCLEMYSDGLHKLNKFRFKDILGFDSTEKIIIFLKESLSFAEENEDFEFLFKIIQKYYFATKNYHLTSYYKVEKSLSSSNKELSDLNEKIKKGDLNKEEIKKIKAEKTNIYSKIKRLKVKRNNVIKRYIENKSPIYTIIKDLWIQDNLKEINRFLIAIDSFNDLDEKERKFKGIYNFALFPE